MGLDLNLFNTDTRAEVEGVWKNIGQGARIKVARAGNERYQEELDRIYKSNGFSLSHNLLSKEETTQLDIEIEAKTVLLDFEGIMDDGKPLENTMENRIRILQVKDVRAMVKEASRDIENFRRAREREDLAALGNA